VYCIVNLVISLCYLGNRKDFQQFQPENLLSEQSFTAFPLVDAANILNNSHFMAVYPGLTGESIP